MPSACLAGCLMEQDWAGRLMRGLTWGRNEVTFQEAEARQSTHRFKRLTLLEKKKKLAGLDTSTKEENWIHKRDIRTEQRTQPSRVRALKGTSHSDSCDAGPKSGSHWHHHPRTHSCPVSFPFPLLNSKESTGLSSRLLPLCVCA